MHGGFDDLVAFVAVVETGSFRAAGVNLERDASVISRRLTQLEERLGVQLLFRTTRSVTLTEAGSYYFRRVRSVLEELEIATREVGGFAATPQGVLKISLPVTFGRDVIAPILPAFLAKYREIRIDAHFLDRTVDIVSEGFDLVIRVGIIRDSSLMARKIGSFRSLLVASPAYVENRGMPETPDALRSHSCLGFTNHPDWPSWVLEKDGVQATLRPEGPLVANSSEALMLAAVQGTGIALVPDWMAVSFLEAGSLVPVLPGWMSVREIGVYAVMPPGTLVPAKTRVFLDTIVEAMRTTRIWWDR
ncbi:LysR family transcriptional regulator [Rhizobium leguminosarum]|uniref:HTH-type transcriptional regulator TtuA n=1 Tax=Rhizobium leguminosarum TaxID=384 RepID=A0A1B1C430_RHILE|nr:LysR family transcriptional regulator [Rhizobium leguminosarum]ANP84538.1 transcriptional regulator [Rhizobium leguminosarum]